MIQSVEKYYSIADNEFGSYKLTKTDGTICYVPLDTGNTDYQEIQQWIADGGTVIDNPPE